MTTSNHEPRNLTAEEAIARLNTWSAKPSEDDVTRLIEAALTWEEGPTLQATAALKESVRAYRDGMREMAYQRGSFGCDVDAETARQDLREAEVIVEVEGRTASGLMLLATGCHIAAKVKRLGGRWIGFGSRPRDETT